jgi:hypothetical protein
LSYSYTNTDSFTLTNAKKLAAKVSADMDQCRLLYGKPLEEAIVRYRDELAVMLAERCVSEYEFGYKTSDEKRIVSWRYVINAAGDLEGGRSGGLFAAADVSKGTMFNFLWTNTTWANLSNSKKEEIRSQHAIRRGDGEPPADGSGIWVRDRTYGSGGVALERKEYRPS